jgi:Fe-S cluster biosynthesis and repair protein YggX
VRARVVGGRRVPATSASCYDGREPVTGDAEPNMSERMVNCVKLGREAPGLDKPPFKGEFGQKLFETVSKEAWKMWLEHSKMLVNEYRLDMTSPAHQKLWFAECDKYFYGDGSQLPPEFKTGEQK